MTNIIDQINEEFKNSPIYYLRVVKADHKDGNIILNGILSSHFQRQVAQALAVGTTDRKYRVINNISVKSRKVSVL